LCCEDRAPPNALGREQRGKAAGRFSIHDSGLAPAAAALVRQVGSPSACTRGLNQPLPRGQHCSRTRGRPVNRESRAFALRCLLAGESRKRKSANGVEALMGRVQSRVRRASNPRVAGSTPARRTTDVVVPRSFEDPPVCGRPRPHTRPQASRRQNGDSARCRPPAPDADRSSGRRS